MDSGALASLSTGSALGDIDELEASYKNAVDDVVEVDEDFSGSIDGVDEVGCSPVLSVLPDWSYAGHKVEWSDFTGMPVK